VCVCPQMHGLTSEDKYPYAFPPCEHHINSTHYPKCGPSQPTPKCDRTAEKGPRFHGKSVYSVASANIQQEILLHGPVEAAFTVYQDFLLYKSGVYKHTAGPQLGGHAIKIMGWGVEGGVKYWLVANSWNEDWGDNGTFKILRGENHCGIESSVVAGAVDTAPTW
jgi:cathepsin B